MTNGAKYRDAEWLRSQFIDEWQTTREIAEKCGCCKSTIENWLHKHDIEVEQGKRHAPDKRLTNAEWLREQYVVKQRTGEDIAQECGCNSATVLRWLDRHSIETKGNRRNLADERLTDEEWLREQHLEKERTVDEIAGECGCTRSTVGRWFHNHGIEMLGRVYQMADRRLADPEWLREQYAEQQRGMPDIAEECGCSVSAVNHWLNKYDIETRKWPGGLSGPEHPDWAGDPFSYGAGWNETKRQAVRERDGYTCQDPRCFVTQAEHREAHGEKLHVHHLRKARRIEDAATRNAKENLITLCRDCHRRWEKMADAGIVPEFVDKAAEQDGDAA